MDSPHPAETLQQLSAFACPVYSSSGLEAVAHSQGVRFEQASRFLSQVFAVTPQIGLLVLSVDDWSAHAGVAEYGATHYDPARSMVITGGEPAGFWHGLVDAVGRESPEMLRELRETYGQPDGRVDLSAHVDLWIVHDLGHAFHYRFPRLWLMEFFADLCLYAYVAEREPAQLSALETLPAVMSRRRTDSFRCHTLPDFEREYTKMGLDNYVWYHGVFFAWAKHLYSTAGVAPLRRLWKTFAGSEYSEISDAELTGLLEGAEPRLAQLVAAWPAQTILAGE
jgi:hypothetical protein